MSIRLQTAREHVARARELLQTTEAVVNKMKEESKASNARCAHFRKERMRIDLRIGVTDMFTGVFTGYKTCAFTKLIGKYGRKNVKKVLDQWQRLSQTKLEAVLASGGDNPIVCGVVEGVNAEVQVLQEKYGLFTPDEIRSEIANHILNSGLKLIYTEKDMSDYSPEIDA